MSSKKKRRATRRAPTKGARRKARSTAAPSDTSDASDGLSASQLLDAPRNLWRAGVEALAGGNGLAAYPQAALQGGLKKLESVFDQRVLDALERASMPSPQALRQLEVRVTALEKLVRRRILETGLRLFNEEGAAKTSTNRIAAELGISPGNLYYHFKSKGQIAEWLIRRFESRIEAITASSQSITALDDLWLTLHLAFEVIHEYRFVYRDANLLMRESQKIRHRVRSITARSLSAIQAMCHGLVEASVIRASLEEVEMLAWQIVFTATCWTTFAELLSDDAASSQRSGHAAYQVLTLMAPYLEPNARVYLTYLRGKYLKRQ
jgi:AcrR family transcriptional regulator